LDVIQENNAVMADHEPLDNRQFVYDEKMTTALQYEGFSDVATLSKFFQKCHN
jgi:hypothetical protein